MSKNTLRRYDVGSFVAVRVTIHAIELLKKKEKEEFIARKYRVLEDRARVSPWGYWIYLFLKMGRRIENARPSGTGGLLYCDDDDERPPGAGIRVHIKIITKMSRGFSSRSAAIGRWRDVFFFFYTESGKRRAIRRNSNERCPSRRDSPTDDDRARFPGVFPSRTLVTRRHPTAEGR